MTIDDLEESKDANHGSSGGFWNRHGANIGLALLVIYVILLAIGTVAEIFDIESILDWWIFRPPGRH